MTKAKDWQELTKPPSTHADEARGSRKVRDPNAGSQARKNLAFISGAEKPAALEQRTYCSDAGVQYDG